MAKNELGFFPTPLPGEDFRSVLYRYHLYSLNPDILDTNQELFGIRNNFTVFPRGLEALLGKLPTLNLEWNSILENHTLLPLLLPFIPEDSISKINHEIRFGGGFKESYVGKLVGNRYGKCISDNIRYCPCCLDKDMSQYGFSYIHREHQLAFISTCHLHSVKLISRCSECNELLMYCPITGKCKNGHALLFTRPQIVEDTLHKDLSNDLQFLFANYKEIKKSQIKQRFMEYLNYEGYLEIRGEVIKRSLLANDLLTNYSNETFSKYGLTEQYIMKWNGVDRFFWDSQLVVNLPLLLLIIRFLAGSMKTFFTVGIPYTCETPFIDGPWSCENKYCPSYHKLSINYYTRVESVNRGLLGRFSCSTCQGQYTLEWRWKRGILKVKHQKIFYPKEKEQQVKNMLSSGFSSDTISRELYCSPNYVKSVVKKKLEYSQLTLFNFREIAAAREEEGVEDPKKMQYRDILLTIMKENPGLSRSKIKTKCTTQYKWLSRHDGDWIERQLPSSKSFERFDWNEVDGNLEVKVREVAKQLIESNPSIRVASYSIVGMLTTNERGRVKNYIKHLPKTDQALRECSETKEQYQIRHLPALVWQLRNHYNYTEVTLDTILSYRRSYRGISDNMKEVLRELLKSL